MTVGCLDFGKVPGFPSVFGNWAANCTFSPAVVGKTGITVGPTTTTSGSVYAVLTLFTRDGTGKADPLAELAALAKSQNGSAFARQVAGIAWDAYAPHEIAQVVQLALAAGAPLPARHISAEGHRLYPEDTELANIARILAPPKVLGKGSANPSRRLDQEWLRQHAHEYRGQWLAIKDGELLAAAPTARELKVLIADMEGMLVTRVA